MISKANKYFPGPLTFWGLLALLSILEQLPLSHFKVVAVDASRSVLRRRVGEMVYVPPEKRVNGTSERIDQTFQVVATELRFSFLTLEKVAWSTS